MFVLFSQGIPFIFSAKVWEFVHDKIYNFKGGLGGEISLSDVIIHLELEGKNTRDNYCSVIITSDYLGAEVFFFIHDAIVTWYCGFAAHRSSNWYMSPGATLKFSTS